MLEKAKDEQDGVPCRSLDWSGVGITIEHIMPESNGSNDDLRASIGHIGNLALLEKRINRELGAKAFPHKQVGYRKSDFHLTQALGDYEAWGVEQIEKRTAHFADLACTAWPAD